MKTHKVRQRQWQRWFMRLENMERKAGNDPAKSGRCLYRVSRNSWDKWLCEFASGHAYRQYKRTGEIPAVTFKVVMCSELKKSAYKLFEDNVFGDLDRVTEQMTGIINEPGIQIKEVSGVPHLEEQDS